MSGLEFEEFCWNVLIKIWMDILDFWGLVVNGEVREFRGKSKVGIAFFLQLPSFS